MNNRLRVRPAGAEDIKTLEALAKEIWEQHYTPIIGKTQVSYMLEKFQSEAAITRDMADGCIYYVACFDGVPCGYSAVIKEEGGIFLSRLYVKQGYRGKGIARAMLDKIREYAQKQRQKRIWLTCSKYDSSTLDTYKRYGFSIGAGATGENDYLLEKML